MRCRANEVIALILHPHSYSVTRICYLVDWNSFRHLP
jgi:hypothetical protein